MMLSVGARSIAIPIMVSLAMHGLAASWVIAFGMRHAIASRRSEGASALAGDTLLLPAPLAMIEVSPDVQVGESPQAPPAAEEATTVRAARPAANAKGRPALSNAPAARPSSATQESFERYGAVGERSAVDLATAFTRAFPQASSEDPLWKTAPFGPAGEVTIHFVVDPEGHLEDTRVSGSPSPPLASALRRTLALVHQNRLYTAQSRMTRLVVRARVTPDTVHDGLHGDVYAIGSTFQNRAGSAFFALAMGRRVDIAVESK